MLLSTQLPTILLFTRFLDPSLRADLRQLGINGTNAEQVTAVKPTRADDSGVVWLADLSLGGCDNLSMKPDPLKLNTPASFESLVQVLGDCGKYEATHRIGLFADRANQGGGCNLWGWIREALNDDSSEGREAGEETHVDAEEKEQGSGAKGGADGSADGGDHGGAASAAEPNRNCGADGSAIGGDDGGAASAAEPNGNHSRNNASQERQETGTDVEGRAAEENASGEDPDGETKKTKKTRRPRRPKAPISKATRVGSETLVNIGMQLLVITARSPTLSLIFRHHFRLSQTSDPKGVHNIILDHLEISKLRSQGGSEFVHARDVCVLVLDSRLPN